MERTCTPPGDELIPEPIASMTHAVTIRRPRRDVWPWLVQMGAGSRAGWYSYDFLDNGRRPSADRLVADLQRVEVGMLVPALPGATDGFHVLQYETERSLVLGWTVRAGPPPLMTWAFVLDDQPDENTRLIVRARGGQDYPFYGLPRAIGQPLIRLMHAVMQRRQLRGIAWRAESQSSSAPHQSASEAA